jgi:hypothetical protein
LIFNRVVQQRRDSHIFVSASLKNQTANRHQVRDVRYRGAFSWLVEVQSRRDL